MVQVDLDKLPFDPLSVWKQAVRRYARAANVTAYIAQSIVHTTISRGDSITTAPIKHFHLCKHLYPLAQLNHLGRLTWSNAMRAEFRRNDISIPPPTT